MELLDLKEFQDGLSNEDHFVYYKLLNDLRIYPYKILNKWSHSILRNKKDELIYEHYSSLKIVSENSFYNLYCRFFNPIYLSISCQTSGKIIKNKDGKELYIFRAMLYSIDDSAYGTVFENLSYQEIYDIIYKFLDWINSKEILDFEEFINFGRSLGGKDNSW